jgi:hypothetical protein
MADNEGGRKWLRCGCWGCLGLVGAAGVLVAIVLAVIYVGSEAEQIEDRAITPPIPSPVAAPDEPAVEPAATELPAQGAGRLVLDMRNGELFIEPAALGEPLNVKARYDRDLCQMEETLEAEREPWLYHLSFECESSGFLQALRQMISGTKPEVRVFLPADLPLHLELHAGQGGVVMDLGGLWLTEMDVDFEMGGVVMDVDEPLRAPMKRMEIHGSMGGLVASSLGNASPRSLVLDYRMGGMQLDLRGQWLQDSDIEIRFRMGGGEVTLPDNVNIEGLATGRTGTLMEGELPRPTLRFATTGDMGGLEFTD